MAPTNSPGNGRHNGQADRRAGNGAVDAARAELARVAAALERDATERITLLKDLLDQAAEQDHSLVERLDGLDEREAEFTRRLREGLHEVDSTVADRLQEVRQLREEFEPALDDAGAERVAELAQKVNDLRGGLQEVDYSISERLHEMRRLRDEREKNALDENAAADESPTSCRGSTSSSTPSPKRSNSGNGSSRARSSSSGKK